MTRGTKIGITLLVMIVGYYCVGIYLEFKDHFERIQYEAVHKSIDWGD